MNENRGAENFNNIGYCYYQSKNIENHYQLANKYFQISANHFYPEALNNLGNCYYYGNGQT